MILRHPYHRGLLLLSSSCYYLSVELVSELGRIVVLPHPDDLDEIHSDSADAPNRGVRLHLAVECFTSWPTTRLLELLLPSRTPR